MIQKTNSSIFSGRPGFRDLTAHTARPGRESEIATGHRYGGLLNFDRILAPNSGIRLLWDRDLLDGLREPLTRYHE